MTDQPRYLDLEEEVAIPEPDAAETPEDTGATQDAVVLGFMGVHGGAGVTSLCVDMAREIAAQGESSPLMTDKRTPKVCLLDLDFESGSCAAYCDVAPRASIDDLDPASSRIDAQLITSMVTRSQMGFDVLALPECLDGNAYVAPEKVLDLLDAVSEKYDVVVIDIPRMWTLWTHAAIAGSDQFFLVSELSVPALHSAQNRMKQLRGVAGLEDLPIHVILNKLERRKMRGQLRLADAQQVLGKTPISAISLSGTIVLEAINRGEAVGQYHADGRFTKDLRAILEKIATECALGRIKIAA